MSFDLFSGWSYFGIILFLILTGCGFPLPEEVAFVYAGVQSALGNLNWALALGACGVGALLGDSVMYGIGRLGRGWIGRHAWFSRIVHLEREEQVRHLIARHGIKVFFAARFMVGVRGPLYVTLGILKVPFWRFLLIDSLCASAVVGLFFWMSYFVGPSLEELIRQGESLITILLIAALAISGVFWLLHRRRKKRASLEAPAAEDEPIDHVTESLLGVPHEELMHVGETPSGELDEAAAAARAAEGHRPSENHNGNGRRTEQASDETSADGSSRDNATHSHGE